MKKSVFLFMALVVLGCGKKEPVFSSPQDKQSYRLPGFGTFMVTLADNDYSDTTIEFRGLEALQGRVSCQNVANGPATCTDMSYSQQNTQYQNQTSRCSQQAPCYNLVAVTAKRGGFSTTIFITIEDIGYTGQVYYR